MNTITRTIFIKTGLLTTAAFLFNRSSISAQDKPPTLKLELVREFVGVCHFNFGKVKELLANEPMLLHSSWDLGGGDFESGIEAAGHVGDTEIADYLLSKGARYNVFLASMYGHLDVVRLILTAQPQLLNARGPHGLTLLHHAIQGRDKSAAVVEYLKSLGAKETKLSFY